MSGLGPSQLHPGAAAEPGVRGGCRHRRVPGRCRETLAGKDKGNILRGCNVNRAGAEPLFMESLSCQGICQSPDLRSYLDKGAGGAGGAELASKSQDSPGCLSLGADKEVAEGPGAKAAAPVPGQGMGAELGGCC